MNLVTLSQNAVASGFKILGSLLTDLILLSAATPTYDDSTGTNTITYTETTLHGIRTSYDLNEISNSGGSIIVTDVKFLLQGRDVVGDIDTQWQVKLGTDIYKIIPPITKNITNSTLILQLRRI